MRRFQNLVGWCCIVMLLLVASVMVAHARGVGSWTYNPSDLSGANCIQLYIDRIMTGTLGTVTATNVSATTLAVSGNETITGNSTVGGTESVAGNATFAGAVAFTPPSAVVITNGQAVTLAADVINLLNASGEAANGTNIITLANVDEAGRFYFLGNRSASTNKIAIALSGTWKSAAVELDPDEGLLFFAVATNEFIGIE